jgi:hypothetical protein
MWFQPLSEESDRQSAAECSFKNRRPRKNPLDPLQVMGSFPIDFNKELGSKPSNTMPLQHK